MYDSAEAFRRDSAFPVALTSAGDVVVLHGGSLSRVSEDQHWHTYGSLPTHDSLLLRGDTVLGLSVVAPGQITLASYTWARQSLRAHTTREVNVDPRFSVDSILPAESGFALALQDGSDLILRCSSVPGRVGYRLVDMQPGWTPAFVAWCGVLFSRDLGVDGMRLRLVNSQSQVLLDVPGSLWWYDERRRVLALGVQDDVVAGAAQSWHIVLVGPRGTERIPVPGVLSDLGGSSSHTLARVFNGDDDLVCSVVSGASGSSFLSSRGAPRGSKTLGRGAAAALIGTVDGEWWARIFTPVLADAQRQPQAPRVLPPTKRLPQSVRRVSNSDSGLVLHFHGGPESYEVPSPRLLNLPARARQHGLGWVGLNYRGSRWPLLADTRVAWHNWRVTILDDVADALRSTKAHRIVLCGWSFGAAVALAVAREFGNVQGVIVGGCVGNLDRHIQRARAVDPAHERWFDARFERDGSDYEFFSGAPPESCPFPVLSFHGRHDPICPYDLMDEVRTEWVRAGANWTHHDLPGGGHALATPADAQLWVVETDSFMRRICVEAP